MTSHPNMASGKNSHPTSMYVFMGQGPVSVTLFARFGDFLEIGCLSDVAQGPEE
jgi:hypothetical protein